VGALVVVLIAAGVTTAVLRDRRSGTRTAAGPSSTIPSAPSTTSTTVAAEPGYVTEIKGQVSELRGLAWKSNLKVDVVSRDELARRYKAGTERDARPDRLAGDGDTFQVLHLIPRDMDYAKALTDLFSGLVLGFYDPETKELVVGDSGGSVSAATKVTLAHELDHALTDQWFEFGARTKALDEADRQEEIDAFDALIEGDAKYLESAFADKHLSEEEQVAVALGALGDVDEASAAKVAKAPRFLLDYLYFPYTDGLTFVRSRAKSKGFAGVDEAYRRPPTSTEQILHPDAYDANDTWAPPPLPDVAAATSCPLRRAGTLGELKMDELLAGQLDGSTAKAAAAGWEGDAFQTVRCGDKLGMVERWQADSDGAAARLASALATWGQGWAKAKSAPGGRFSGGGGTGKVVRSGSRVDLVVADDAATADKLAAAL